MEFNSQKSWIITLLSRLGTWILIFTNLVPISLLVTMEMIKYIQGMFIAWDVHLYDKEKRMPARVQTSTLNEELGQVKVISVITLVYIF
jgi:phospholipid-transporting ATPase